MKIPGKHDKKMEADPICNLIYWCFDSDWLRSHVGDLLLCL